MSTTAATGFCRVTVVAPDSRIDVALPVDIAIADVYPEILRLTGQTQEAGTPTGYHLVRRDGRVLDGGRTLADERILDGEVLSLRPFAESLPPAVYDDVADAVASAVVRDRHLWSDGLLRAAGLAAGAVLLVMCGLVLWYADPVRHDMHGLPGIVAGGLGVLLTAFAGVRARVYADRAGAVAIGLGTLPLLLIAGCGIVGPEPGQGPGALQFMLGCAVALIASVALVALTPGGDAPFVAAAFAATAGTLAGFAAVLTDASATDIAAGCAPVAIGMVAFLPALSSRFARLPIGYASPRSTAQEEFDPEPARRDVDPLDAERIAAQARRGHEMLLGLVGGTAAVVVASAAVLGFSDDVWAQLLALASGLAMLLRARLFRYTAQVSCVLAAGFAAVVLLLLGLALNPPGHALTDFVLHGDRGALDLRTIWLTAAITAGALLVTAIGLIVPRTGLSPFWGRCMEIGEGFVLLTLVPLALAVFDVYATVRSMTR